MTGGRVAPADDPARATLPGTPPGDAARAADSIGGAHPTIRRLLLTGVIASASLLLAGLGLEVARGRYTLSPGPPASWWGSFGSDPSQSAASALLVLGLLLLALTPVARVVVSAGYFAAARDRPFTYLTVFVLLVLALSVVVGLRL